MNEMLGLTCVRQQAPDVDFERALRIRLALESNVMVIALDVYLAEVGRTVLKPSMIEGTALMPWHVGTELRHRCLKFREDAAKLIFRIGWPSDKKGIKRREFACNG